MRLNRTAFVATLIVAGITLSIASTAAGQSAPALTDTENMNFASLRALVNLMGVIAENNPDWRAVLDSVEQLDSVPKGIAFNELVSWNRANPAIRAGVESFKATPAYRSYSEMRTASPYNPGSELWLITEDTLLYSLPYRQIETESGIERALMDLFRHREAVNDWMNNTLSKLDTNRVLNIAREWLPEGQYETPVTYFTCDGAGSSRDVAGHVYFDIGATLFSRLPDAERFSNLDDIDTDQVEHALASEYVRIHAGRVVFGRLEPEQELWFDKKFRLISERVVWEGVSLQCSPPTGMERAMLEDSQIVGHWMDSLRAYVKGAREGSITPNEFYDWLRRSTREAMKLSEGFLSRTGSDDEIARRLADNERTGARMEKVLGWWVISRIAESDGGRERVIRVLNNPMSVYAVYDSIAAARPSLPAFGLTAE